MTPAVSVCIPVYGTEKSLPACLQSVAGQQGLDCGGRGAIPLEIIVVNDASPSSGGQASCAELVSRFQKTSPHPVRYLEHEENLGLVEARRTAVEAASGNYIFCLDSDDTLPAAAVATLHRAAVESNADIVHGKARVVVEREGCQLEGEALEKVVEKNRRKVELVFEGQLEGGAILQNTLVERGHSNFLWGKLIRRELYLEALSLIPSMYCTMAEDVVQYLLIAHGAGRYCGISDVIYNYTVNTGISSNTKITSLARWEQVCSTASVFTVLFACLEDLEPPFTAEQQAAIRRMCRFYVVNNLQQLHNSVDSALQQQAYAILCDYWGEGLVKRMEAVMAQEKDSPPFHS